METRARKYGPPPASPERSRPCPEPSPPAKHQQARKIPVVYYLCRNRHLEHPHFMEVPLSTPDGLYLRDVINRLNLLRGKGMPARYSWSCKRSYKNGFVWHDLSEDDLILPSQGNEFVLKGSELLDQSPPDQSSINPKLQPLKPSQQEIPISLRTQEASSSSSPPTIAAKEAKTRGSPPRQLEEVAHSPDSSREISPEIGRPRSYETSSPVPAEYPVYKPHCAADASTQTDNGGLRGPQGMGNTCTRGVSTNNGSSPDVESENCIERNEISPPLTSSSASSWGGTTETLESLIRAEASKMNRFRIREEQEVLVPSAVTRLKATNMLMQLITCGSISVKDHHTIGLVQSYRPKFSHVRFPSPMFSGSMMMGELECLRENARLMGLRMEDKEYFSGSLIETNKHKEGQGEIVPTLKRSSSYNADRSQKSPDSKREKERIVDSSRSKCLPRTIKMTPSKQSRNESMRSPLSDCPRNSSAGLGYIHPSKGGSKRITDASKEGKERLIKIEERLTSGARVIIQSRAPCDDSEGSSSS